MRGAQQSLISTPRLCGVCPDGPGHLSARCAVGNVADLLQITEEKLSALFEERADEIPFIEE